jgi:hypothetical protein
MKFTSFFLQRVQSILFKDSARREENKINLFVFYSEPPPILSKDSARREENKINLFVFFNYELAWQMAFYAAKNVRTRIFLYL